MTVRAITDCTRVRSTAHSLSVRSPGSARDFGGLNLLDPLTLALSPIGERDRVYRQ